MPIVPVILAGGQGTRLWPMSRTARPKQFLPLTGPTSLYQQTLKRVSDTERYGPAVILTNAEYRFIVAEQALEIAAPLAGVLLEPVARNTAAAIAAAAAYVATHVDPDAVLHILPSDHDVVVDADYWAAIDAASRAASSGRLVTFGIRPTRPETGYGYIQTGDNLGEGVYSVARFTEKPDLETAQRMLDSGDYAWNSGMFMMKASTFLEEAKRLAPQTLDAARKGVEAARSDLDFVRLDEASFAAAPDISVDYAIFEKTSRAAVMPVSFTWSDLGAWDAVWDVSEKDAAGNVGVGPVTFSDSERSLVVSEGAHVALEGLSDIAVIASEDAIFVGRLSDAQKVGPLVKRLKTEAHTRALTEIHKTAYRPWGGYSSVLSGERFQVKRLFVKPGKKLSLQKHHHRSEHWIVVRGTAEVTIDGTVQMVMENQSVYLPLGCTHRLANPGKILLELIEVQTGSYLGEDDIIRIEDEFGRA
ncbi:mannose-1-phosphate guanylyltransferase/mannose-6-phosphate isomerase [Devosia sp. PTR5]|uniref:mannose-1-phosphate guanylyltransferase n=1 Tax=Devosia oryzisoli TaxID=2774138 RepID=A0A927FU61_9HYPH|nr:mannose-1-phosphate guanylyltransferase/mannose-6-phosphate isomerase [Devosia oryzisoli]MBD8064963.1 mannose-1-phosphate guanylyltransferase/mannose-6-phosphate isomerase [Devosia oryzisoli]